MSAIDITKATLYVVSDDGFTPMSFDGVVAMVNGTAKYCGIKGKDYSIFTNMEEAQAEYTRRCAANEVIAKVKKEEYEVILVIERAIDIIAQRNSNDQRVRDKAKTLIDLLNAAEVRG